MPIYEYVCSSCNQRTDILQGVHDAGPNFCPECGAENSMRKAFAPPAIHFKGTGWAKKDRGSATRTKAAAKADGESKPSGSESSTAPAESTSSSAPSSSDPD